MPKKQHFWKKNMVANFGFNCKNGKVSPILRLHAITRVRITPKLNFCPKFCQKWSFKFNLIISNVWCQIVLVPNCPVPNCPGAKLSWCQIVHFYYLGAKLSAFIILVPNCPLYYLGAKLSGAKLSGAKLSYNQNQVPYFSFQTYTSPKWKTKKKRSFILMRTQIGFNLKCIAQCICSKSSGLTFLDNVWFGMFERSLRPVLRVADSP